jgi:hypothetical protein
MVKKMDTRFGKMDLREIGWDGMVWIEFIWLRIGTSGGLL